MSRLAVRCRLGSLLVALLAILPVPTVARATTVYGITAGDRLVTFDTTAPTAATAQPITGLQPGETILGLDMRPRDGELYGVGSTGRVYRISPSAVAVEVLGPRTLPAGSLGLDIDGIHDRLRIVSTLGDHLVMAFDGTVETFATVTPAGQQIAGIASTPSYFGAAGAVLYGIDVQNDHLVRFGTTFTPTLETGSVTTVLGSLGIDVTTQVALDVEDAVQMWMAAEVATMPGASRLYAVDTNVGVAVIHGVIGGPGFGVVTALAAPVPPALRLSATTYSVSEGAGSLAIQIDRFGPAQPQLSAQFNTFPSGTATPGVDYTVQLGVVVNFPAGSLAPQTVTIPILQDTAVEGQESFSFGIVPAPPAQLAGPFLATATIVDDDLPPPGMPSVTITLPTTEATFSVGSPTIRLGGTASDSDGTIVEVRWTTSSGLSGTAAGTTSWVAPDIVLPQGATTITVTALDDGGLVAMDTLVVTAGAYEFAFAEGVTGSFFSTDVAVANVSSTTFANYTLRFLTERGDTVLQNVSLGPQRRTTVKVDDIPALASTAFSMQAFVTPSRFPLPGELVMERTVRWRDDFGYGANSEKAATSLSRTWYFAEGAQGFFSTYLLIANLADTATTATVDWLRESATPLRRTYVVAPNSRLTVDASADPELVGHAFGITVELSQPGIAERAMYFGSDPLFTGGHQSSGVTAPFTEWFLAEGATGSFFTTFILLANPNSAPVDVTLTGYRLGSTPVAATVTVPANGRRSINLATIPGLENAAVSTRVVASAPIVAERAQYWPGLPSEWQEAHNAFGLTATGRRWGLAEGRVGNPAQFPPGEYQTYILLANPGTAAASVTIRFLLETATPVVKTFTVPAASRFNVRVAGPEAPAADNVPELVDTTFGALIESDQPIAVERAMYGNAGAVIWAAGTNATATRLP